LLTGKTTMPLRDTSKGMKNQLSAAIW